MKKNFKLFCFGFGQVAKYFVKNLKKKNYMFVLVATNTTKTQLKEFNNLKYKSYFFLNDKFDKDLINELETSTKILVSIPPIKEKDLVIICDVGAYGSTLSSNYNIRAKPAEILVKGTKIKILEKRQKLRDLI